MTTQGVRLTQIHSSYRVITLTLLVLALPAQAALITFDDLPTNNEEPTALTDQYAALGVTFGGAAVDDDYWNAGVISEPNVATDHYGPGMEVYFTDVLPNSISLYVSTAWGQSAYINFWNSEGEVAAFVTDGWRGLEELSTPYQPRQLISFTGAEISHISLGDFYGRRGSLMIDDLAFERVGTEVSEPPVLSLFAVGILLLMQARRHQRAG